MSTKLRVICLGIKIKLRRGANLEEILSTYVNLTEDEKTTITNYLVVQE
jgi:hypothetical protein